MVGMILLVGMERPRIGAQNFFYKSMSHEHRICKTFDLGMGQMY